MLRLGKKEAGGRPAVAERMWGPRKTKDECLVRVHLREPYLAKLNQLPSSPVDACKRETGSPGTTLFCYITLLCY
jgi:hypothetical protein